jgi:hypothetical protein
MARARYASRVPSPDWRHDIRQALGKARNRGPALTPVRFATAQQTRAKPLFDRIFRVAK